MVYAGPAHLVDSRTNRILATANVTHRAHELGPDMWYSDEITTYYLPNGTPVEWRVWFEDLTGLTVGSAR